MAKKTQAQIEFSAVTKDFDAGVKRMNAQLKTFGNELKLNSTQLKGNADDVGLLQDRQKILQAELEASKTKVNLQEQALAKCKEMLGENSTEYRNLTNLLLQAKNQQAAIENEIKKTEKALANASQETQQAASAWDKLSKEIDEQESELSKLSQEYKEVVLSQGKGSKEAKELEGKINALNSELKENKAEMKKADDAADELTKSLDKLGEEAKDTGDGFTIGKGAIASFIGNGLSSLVDAVGNGISSIAGLGDETREYRNEMGKLEVAFAEGGYSAETATKTYKDFQAVLGDEGQSVEAVSHLAKLTSSEKELEQWTTICTGVYATFGASLPIEGLTEAANETAKVGQVTGPLADALNWAGVNEDKFNESLAKCSTEQERQQLITSTLNGLYTDAAQKYRDTNKEVMDANKAQSDYADTMAKFGEKVEPITTTVKQGFNGLLQEVLGLTEDADIEGFTSAIQSGFATVKDTVLPAVVEAFGKLKDAWQWLSEHTGLLTAVATVIGVITTAITAYNIVQGIKTAMDAANVTTVWALVAAHIAQAAAAMAAIAPYILIVAAIAAVIAIIVLCVKNWDKIKEKVAEVIEKMKEKITEIKEHIQEKFDSIKEKITSVFTSIKDWIQEKIDAVKQVFTNLWEHVVSVFETIKNAISVAIQFIGSIFSAAFQIITLPFRFIWENCKEYVFAAFEWIKEKIGAAIDKIKEIAQKGFELVKEKIINPIINVKDKAVALFTAIKNAIQFKINELKYKVHEIFEAIKEKIITPITNAKNKAVEMFENIKTAIQAKITQLKYKVSAIFEEIKAKIMSPIIAAKNKAIEIFNNIKSSISDKITSLRDKVATIFNSIKEKITSPIEKAKKTVSDIVDKIKNLFNNMKLKFPNIKLPHFSVTGKFSLNPPSVPKLSINWNAKGGLFTKPTVMQGFGEAGHEYAIPLNERSVTPLAAMINKLSAQGGGNGLSEALASRFDMAVDKLADRLERLEMAVNIDGERVATVTASHADAVGGIRYELINRGLAIK